MIYSSIFVILTKPPKHLKTLEAGEVSDRARSVNGNSVTQRGDERPSEEEKRIYGHS